LVSFIVGLGLFLIAILIVLGFIHKNSQFIRKIGLLLTLIASIILVVLALNICIKDRPLAVTFFQITPELQFSFDIDRLSAFFIFIIAIVSASVSIYSLRYVERESISGIRKNLFVPMIGLFILSMILFVASDNAFSQITFWELMSLTSFFLVMIHYEKEETRKSGTFYFIMTQMSTIFLLMAFIIIYNLTGSFNLQHLTGVSTAMESIIFLLLFAGFGIKAGIIPFHKWLPYAHSSSPSNVSALMSGVMIKVAIYGMLRYVLFVLDPTLWWGILILIAGTVSALLGVVYALKEHDIKRLLAYHSIENIGIILIGFGSYIIFQYYGFSSLAFLSLAASLFHTLNHAIFKSLLFLTAGSVVEETSTRDIEKMGGLVKTMPVTAILFLIGAIAISALPPLNGFVSELMIFQAFFRSFSIANSYVVILMFICLSLFALTSALAAACFVKAFGIIFLAMPRSEKAKNAREVSVYMLIGPGILALICILLGVFSYQIFQFLGYQPPIPDLLFISVLILVFMIVTFVVLYFVSNRKSRIADTWACGLPDPGPQTEYTASGFSEPILTFFKPIYRTQKSIERSFWDERLSIFKNGNFSIHTMKIFEEKLYEPVSRFIRHISLRVSNAQNVDLDTFILYSFITIIILLIAVWWIL
jgi:hydrogenase-4 component B